MERREEGGASDERRDVGPAGHVAAPVVFTAPSRGGVRVAVREVHAGGGPGTLAEGDARARAAPVVLLLHACGMHGATLAPLGAEVARRVPGGARVVAPDLRGHGATDGGGEAPPLDWNAFADDALAVVAALRARGAAGPVFAVGNSLGGAAALLAAARDPGAFAGLVLYEPVVASPGMPLEQTAERTQGLVAGARRRRTAFPSRAAALEAYAAKMPFKTWAPEALRLYVAHGLRLAPGGGAELCCAPEVEAETYAQGVAPGLFAGGTLAVPAGRVAVLAGVRDPGPRDLAEGVAGACGTDVRWFEEVGHFGMMEDPSCVGAAVAELLCSWGAGPKPRL